jgi:hypothetical protein
MEQNLTQRVQGIYDRVNALWRLHESDLFSGACGFSILSGPPVPRPSLMLIGANPGFGVDDHEPRLEASWPPTSYIGDADWTLARKLRSIFAEAKRPEALKTSLQTNFLFFKSSSLSREGRYPWLSVSPSTRAFLEHRCSEEVIELIKNLRPGLILVLGLDPFDRHALNAETIMLDRTGKRRLLVTGDISGQPAIGVLHPSGARVAAEDWTRVSAYLATRIPAEG